MTLNKRLSFLIVFALTTTLSKAQNLVSDPSFESYTSTFCGIQFASDFDQIMTEWENPTQASPQVFFTNLADTCYNNPTDSQYNGPIGLKGDQLPRSGGVMVGLWAYTIPNLNQRHYVRGALSTPMVIGESYAVAFYVSLGDFMEFSIDKMGAYLSTDQPVGSTDGPLPYTPQVVSEGFLDDVTQWVLVSDTIVAEEAYAYITIGNFSDDNATNTQVNPTSTGEPGTYGAFYFVDDVSAVQVSTIGVNDLEKSQVKIYPTAVVNTLTVALQQGSWISICDSQGKLLSSEFIPAGLNEINTAALSTGFYFVTVQNERETVTRRIVK